MLMDNYPLALFALAKTKYMQIFNNYIEKHTDKKAYIKTAAHRLLNNIIVIPCYNEANILQTLKSIKKCQSPQRAVEILVVINSGENTPVQIVEQNKRTLMEIKQWSDQNNTDLLKFHVIYIDNIHRKQAGAGFARKLGMDEAVKRFAAINNSNGLITSLDADCKIAANYLIEIENIFQQNPKTDACSIYFEHPISGTEFATVVYDKIVEYELYMRYYSLSLKFTGFPYYYHTVGSSFAVKAQSYCKQGGMNKKKAGEDFYFLHKMMPLGNYHYLKTTRVYPSPRPSERVPFGTGPVINKLIKNHKTEFETYKFDVFLNLADLFAKIDYFYRTGEINILEYSFHPSMNNFLLKNDFNNVIKEINNNTANIKSFQKRFFNWFDAFRIIKYINFAHKHFYEKVPIRNAAKEYLKNTNNLHLYKDNLRKLLTVFRQIELNH